MLPDTYSHPKLYDIIIEENTLLPDAYILHSTQGWEVIENHCQVCQKVASGDLFHHTNNIRVENRTYIQHNNARVELDDGERSSSYAMRTLKKPRQHYHIYVLQGK